MADDIVARLGKAWIAASGLATPKTDVTFAELSELLREAAAEIERLRGGPPREPTPRMCTAPLRLPNAARDSETGSTYREIWMAMYDAAPMNVNPKARQEQE